MVTNTTKTALKLRRELFGVIRSGVSCCGHQVLRELVRMRELTARAEPGSACRRFVFPELGVISEGVCILNWSQLKGDLLLELVSAQKRPEYPKLVSVGG
ncbi:hypothetical protein F511_33683 [Dorcoceras hygrometricum]|uniref:Uncharacterized protein n=1 Tax=Dorcoceras hygrometricum TaxID=472368 RepID=A0A2Z7BVK0_9LAMI|nr:hypothetical protein F511_33683 [Dorcoceras hygrometricum]